MVFPGRFSTGCSRCRQRKVKCDEKKPTCRRCDIYGKPCPGYTDTFHFRIGLTQNDFEASPPADAGATRTPPKSRQTSIVAVSQPSPTLSTHSNALAVQRSPPAEGPGEAIYRLPELSYEQLSLSYFIKRFVSPDRPDGVPGHLSFLPDLYDHHHEGVLEVATKSVAQMAAFNQFGCERFRLESYRNYARVIRMMQEAIQTKDSATDDKVITSVLLLCTLKDIVGEGSGDPNEHASGLFYLLEERGPNQIFSRRGAELFLLALLRLQIYSFLHEDDTYTDPGAIATVLGEFDPLLRAFSLMSKTLSLRHALARYLSSQASHRRQSTTSAMSIEDGAVTDGTEAIRKCFETLEDFRIWDIEAAAYWEQTVDGRVVPTTLGLVASDTTWYDAETACILILIRSARLILLVSMLLYYGKTQGPTADRRCSTQEDGAAWAACVPILEDDVRKTLDDMISSVPYALGDIGADGQRASMPHDGAGAIVIVHSVRLVASCAYVTSAQFEKAQSILSRINATIGIRSAAGPRGTGTDGAKWEREQDFLRTMALSRVNFLDSWIEPTATSPTSCGTSPFGMDFESVV